MVLAQFRLWNSHLAEGGTITSGIRGVYGRRKQKGSETEGVKGLEGGSAAPDLLHCRCGPSGAGTTPSPPCQISEAENTRDPFQDPGMRVDRQPTEPAPSDLLSI